MAFRHFPSIRLLLALAFLSAIWEAAAQDWPVTEILAGNNQRVPVLGATSERAVIRITLAGQPMVGLAVTFYPDCDPHQAGYPCLSPIAGISPTQVTDAQGVVRSPFYQANGTQGQVGVAALFPYGAGTTGSGFSIRIISPGSTEPVAIQVVSGDNQEVEFGRATSPVVVRVVDEAGRPVAGAGLTGYGECSAGSLTQPCYTSTIGSWLLQTDAAGLASIPRLVSNSVAGSYRFNVYATGQFLDTAVFTVTNKLPRKQATIGSATGSGPLTVRLADGPLACRLDSAVSVSAFDAGAPRMIAFPHGLLRLELTGCVGSPDLTFTIEHPGGLPEGTRVWSLSPPSPKILPSTTPTAVTTQFTLVDGGDGDSDHLQNGTIIAIVGLGLGDPVSPNFQDLWWAGPAENGWGVSIAQSGDMLFNMLFVYDAAGQPSWYAMPGGTWNAARDEFSGPIYAPRGKPIGAHTAADLVAGAAAGTVSIKFTDPMNATLTLEARGVVITRQITRQLFGPLDSAGMQRRGGMWWAGPSQNGWGIVLQQQYSSLFGLVFTYREDGSPTWFSMPSGFWTVADTFEGRTYRATNPTWVKAYDAAQLTITDVGTFKLQFDAGTAGFDYVLEGRSGRVGLERLPF